VGINVKYKDSLFSFLFSDPDLLRELYSAIEGVKLPADVPVNINTLQDMLFMGRVNDISFEIGGKLVVLIEHQSTINPNMALRLLMYIARVYEKIVGDKNIAEKCKTLGEYSAFIEKVRELEKETKNLEEAFKKAVIYCRDHEILKEFLEKNATEVMNMLMTEWKMEDALAFRFEEGIEKVTRNVLAQGISPEMIHAITGLDIETTKAIHPR
jgi:hypothetical protein